MARKLTSGAGSGIIWTVVGGEVHSVGGSPIHIFSDAAGTLLADIAAYNPLTPTVPGASIPSSELVADTSSRIPLFWGPPDGTEQLWARIGLDGALFSINPAMGPTVALLTSRVAILEGAGAPLPLRQVVTVDFGHAGGGEDFIAQTTVAAASVAANSVIVCSPLGTPTADHDPQDPGVENVAAYAGNIVPGVSFDVIAHTPNGTWGRYNIAVMG